MRNRFPVLLAAAAFLILLSTPASAQETARYENFEDVPSYFFMHLKKLPVKDSYMSFFTKAFDAASEKRDRITAQDIDRARAPLKEELKKLYWMMAKQMDDNGNDLIERAEIERQSQIKNMSDTPSNRNKFLEAVGAWTMYDADGDGVLTREEATALTKGRIVYGFPYEVWLSMNVPDFLVLDEDKDGILHRAEFLAQAEKTFNTFDVNGDGTLAAEEMKVFSTMSDETHMTLEDQILMNDLIEFRGKKFCELPEPERGAQTILIAMPMGTLSSAAILDETERTSAAEVVIDAKAPKTYLVLHSNTRTIWRIAGDVAKVTHVVVVGPENAFDKKTYSAVVGLPKEKVTFASETECTATTGDMMRPERLWRTVKVLETALGRPFTAKEIYGLLVRATVSDGAVTGIIQNKMPPEAAPEGFDAVMWQNYVSSFHEYMLWFTEDEIKSAVADKPLLPYSTPPAGYGLAKLVHDGVLLPVENGKEFFVERDKGMYALYPNQVADKVVDRYKGYDFKIMKPFAYFPSQLHAKIHGRYIKDADTPMPQGDPAACVVDAKTGEPFTGQPSHNCR